MCVALHRGVEADQRVAGNDTKISDFRTGINGRLRHDNGALPDDCASRNRGLGAD